MDARTVHQQSLQFVEQYLGMVMADVTPEHAHWVPPGTMQTIAATYAHVLLSVDWQHHTLLRGQPALYEGAWQDKTGITPLSPTPNIDAAWGKSVQVDLEQARTYGAAVFAAMMDFVNTADLEQEMDMSGLGLGKMSVSMFLSAMVVGHVYLLIGQIAALKGIQGLKGDAF